MGKKQDREFEVENEAPAAAAEAPVMPDVPEGLDEAIFREGWLMARKAEKDPDTPPPANPFAQGTKQADAWDAGFGA